MSTSATPTTDPTARKPPRRRRWIPLSLRMFVVILMLVFAGGTAWITVKGCRQAAIVSRIKEAGGTVRYHGQVDSAGKVIAGAQPRGPAWLRRMIGDDFFDEPVSIHIHYANSTRRVPEAASDVMSYIARLPHLK